MSDFEERESVVLCNEGEKMFGVLHLPKGVKKPPCVLFCHGLAGHKTGRYRVYVELAEALVKAKIAVLRFDFRGSGDSEGDFKKMTLSGEVSDAEKAFDFLANEPRIDQSRIGVFGRSLGGAVAVLSAFSFGKIKSIALWAPMFNGDQWRHKWEKVQSGAASEMESQEMRRINGQVAGMPFWAQMFSMNLIKELTALQHVPLLLIHGEQDGLIALEHSELYVHARQHCSAVTEFIRLPNADHDFTHTEERSLAIDKTSQWFKETL